MFVSPNLTPLDEESLQKKGAHNDELLARTLDAAACMKEREDQQHAIFAHKLQSALMLTVRFRTFIVKRNNSVI
jgi:hypothetical protein